MRKILQWLALLAAYAGSGVLVMLPLIDLMQRDAAAGRLAGTHVYLALTANTLDTTLVSGALMLTVIWLVTPVMYLASERDKKRTAA